MPVADVISYLDAHQGAATALLTAVLIAVTVYYAIQNKRMAVEMRRSREEAAAAREEAMKPVLGLEFHRLGPTSMTVAIRNVGPGTAFDIDVRMQFIPLSDDAQPDEQRWRGNLLRTGEQHDFMPPGELNNNMNTLPERYREIRLAGTVRDAEGRQHNVGASFGDLAEWREALSGARQRWVIPDAERRLADELAKRLQPLATQIAAKLDQIATALYDLRQPRERDDA